MTVESTITSKTFYPGGALAAQSLAGLIFADRADLQVWTLDAQGVPVVQLALDEDYAIIGSGFAGTAAIRPLAAWDNDVQWLVQRRTEPLQLEEFPLQQPLSSQAVERGLDLQARVAQELRGDTNRAMLVPVGETGIVLPRRAARARKALFFDENGKAAPVSIDDFATPAKAAADRAELIQSVIANAVPNLMFDDTAELLAATPSGKWAGTWEDQRLRIYLNNDGEAEFKYEPATAGMFSGPDGSGRMGHRRSGAGTLIRTVEQKLGDHLDLRDFSGLDLTGANDSASCVQAAINEAIRTGEVLHTPSGDILLGETITANGSFAMHGPIWPSRRNGDATWFHIAHTGKGFNLAESGNAHSTDVRRIGTFRSHPSVASGWEPTAHDWDFDILGDDVSFSEVNMLNPYKGIRLNASGRLEVEKLRGQPLGTGLEVVSSLDVCRLLNIHFWPFWSGNDAVRDWMLNNATGIYSKRNDNPHFAFIFSIWMRNGLRFGRNAGGGAGVAGVTNKFKAFCLDFDVGTQGVVFDSDADNTSGDFFGLSVQGRDDAASFANALFDLAADGCDISVKSFRATQGGGNLIRVDGTGNSLEVDGLQTGAYNLAGLGTPIIEAVAGNDVQIRGQWRKQVAGNAVGCSIEESRWTSYTPTVTAGSGTITTLGAVTGKYRRRGTSVEWQAVVPITTNGTGSGLIAVSLPSGLLPSAPSVGTGRETNSAGSFLQVLFDTAQTSATVVTFDNLYPGGNGRRLVLSGSYEVA